MQARAYLYAGTPFEDSALRRVFALYRAWKRGHGPEGAAGLASLPPNLPEAFEVLEDVEWWVGRELDRDRERRGYEFLARLLGGK